MFYSDKAEQKHDHNDHHGGYHKSDRVTRPWLAAGFVVWPRKPDKPHRDVKLGGKTDDASRGPDNLVMVASEPNEHRHRRQEHERCEHRDDRSRPGC